MKRYAKYKDSGAEWIGDIPEGWEKTKFKYETLKSVQYGLNLNSDKYSQNGIRFLRTTDIDDNGNICNDGVYLASNDVLKEQLLEKYDFLISRSGTLGRTYLHLNQGLFSYAGYLVRFNFGNLTKSKFIFYFSKSKCFSDWIILNTIQSTIGNVNGEKYANLILPLPPLKEQEQIVAYLDEKTSHIDKLLDISKRKIELLKEQRASIINQVVIKGLNPNAKMKHSGVEWIGDIPESWGVVGLTKIIKIRHGHQFREIDFKDDGIKVIKITQLDKNGFLNIENCSFIDSSRVYEFKEILIKEEDVLMCLTGGTIGKIIKVGKVNEPLVQNYRVGHFSPINSKIQNNFMFWSLTSNFTLAQILYELRETGQPNIGMEDFSRMKIILPPLEEQEQIVAYLDEKTSTIDKSISIEERRIGLLKEYRQSIISQVITGKIKVIADE